MNGDTWIFLALCGALLVFLLKASFLSKSYSLDRIKSKTVGDGQHGTARWATPKEIGKTYHTVPFRPRRWRKGKELPTEQGLILGSVGGRKRKGKAGFLRKASRKLLEKLRRPVEGKRKTKKKSKALDLELTSSSILIETGGKKMKKLLIIYYSWSNGNTERIAKMLQSETDSDILKIDTVVPYSGSYDDVVNQGQNEVQRGYEPEIKPLDINIADYDVIAVGTPTWWYTMAPAVKTFLHQQDFTGKTVVPFMTNGGWPGHVIKDMKAACKGANVVCDMQIQFDSTGGSNLETPQEQINEWIQSVKNLL